MLQMTGPAPQEPARKNNVLVMPKRNQWPSYTVNTALPTECALLVDADGAVRVPERTGRGSRNV